MPRTSPKPADVELLPTDSSIPEGAKEVRRTTVERFVVKESQPAEQVPSDELDHAASDHGPSVGDEELPTSDLVDLDLDDAELSPRDIFIRELGKETDGRTGPLTFYAKRKPDLPGASYRNPCSTDTAVGDVPFSEDNLCWDAIELATQKLYGGGRYQVIVREGGQYLGAKTFVVADLPERQNESPTNGQAQPQAATPTTSGSPLDQVRASIEIVREVATLLPRPAETTRTFQPPTPPDPIETARNAVNLVKELNSFGGFNGGGNNSSSEGGERSSVRDWMEGIAGIAREFGFGPILNNMVAYGLRNNERMQAEKAAAKAQQGNGTSAPAAGPDATQPTPTPTPEQSHQHVVPPAQPAPVASLGGGLEMLPPPMRAELDRTLKVFVSEMYRSEESDEHQTDEAVAAIQEFVNKYPDAFTLVDNYFMQQSPVRVLLLLGDINPEWRSLIDLKDGAGFTAAVQEQWIEAKVAEQEAATNATDTEQ